MGTVYRYSINRTLCIVTSLIHRLSIGLSHHYTVTGCSLSCVAHYHRYYDYEGHDSKGSNQSWPEDWPHILQDPKCFKHDIHDEEYSSHYNGYATDDSGCYITRQMITVQLTVFYPIKVQRMWIPATISFELSRKNRASEINRSTHAPDRSMSQICLVSTISLGRVSSLGRTFTPHKILVSHPSFENSRGVAGTVKVTYSQVCASRKAGADE